MELSVSGKLGHNTLNYYHETKEKRDYNFSSKEVGEGGTTKCIPPDMEALLSNTRRK